MEMKFVKIQAIRGMLCLSEVVFPKETPFRLELPA